MEYEYGLGDVVKVVDSIDEDTFTYATIRLLEADEEIGLVWLYLVANNHELNTKFDPKVGYFWRLIDNTDPYLTLHQKAFD